MDFSVSVKPGQPVQAKNGEQLLQSLGLLSSCCVVAVRSSWQPSAMQQGVKVAIATTIIKMKVRNIFTVRN